MKSKSMNKLLILVLILLTSCGGGEPKQEVKFNGLEYIQQKINNLTVVDDVIE